MKKKLTFTLIVIGVLIVGSLGFFIFKKQGDDNSPVSVSESASDSFFTPVDQNQGADFSDNQPPAKNFVSSRQSLTKTYFSEKLGFSFNYPEGFNVSGFAEGEIGYTILAQKAGSRESFQIFVLDFDEPGPITPPRIEKDIPDMVMESPQDVLVGTGKNIRALVFFSRNESLGRTREVWFVQNGRLFQLTAYADMDNIIGPVLETLKFQ